MAELSSVIYALAVALALFYARGRGVPGLLYGTVFLIPWYGLMKDVGVTVNADRFLAAVLLGVMVMRFGLGAFSVFSVFVAYFVSDTVAMSLSLPPSAADYSPTRGQWRWLLQLPMWALLIIPGAAVARLGSLEVVRKVVRVLTLSGTVLGALAILQFVTFHLTDVDLFPIGVFSEQTRYASLEATSFFGGKLFRACALGGEPKHLAYTLAICLTFLFANRASGNWLQIAPRVFLVGVAICGVGLVLTFSTQGFVLLAMNMVVLFIVMAALRGFTSSTAASAIVLPVFLTIVALVPGLYDLLYARTVGRLASDGILEDWNLAVWDWIRDTPTAWAVGVGLGNVHLYASRYVPHEFVYYMRGNVFVAKAGVLRLLSELGSIGVIIFLMIAVRPLRGLWSRARSGSNAASFIGACAVAVVCDFLVTNDGPTFVYLLIGAAVVVARQRTVVRRPEQVELGGARVPAAS